MKVTNFLNCIYVLISMLTLVGYGQQEEIQWSAQAKQTGDQTYDLVFTAELQSGWHIYAQRDEDATEESIVIPTTFSFPGAEKQYALMGSTQQPQGITKLDEVLGETVTYFENTVAFVQSIRISDRTLETIDASVEFMICNDTQCLPPDVEEFNIQLSGTVPVATTPTQTVSEFDKRKTEALRLPLKGQEQYLEESVEDKGYFSIFFLGFLGGLIALLTPCVFPLIPLTVSFFTKSSQSRSKGVFNATFYGICIVLIYGLLSLPFHLLDSVDPEVLNTISTNTFLNLLFFLIFIIFSFSFFGFYEITLPSSWGAAMDSNANRIGGLIGIFFMALTLALVSFSCTGPILGSLLGGSLSSDGGALQITYGMVGFGLALALPFTVFALFPNWLSSLPKSGGWLTSVKVVLGFIELAFAFKFLSNADLVEHWGLLSREVFIGIWIVISIALTLYLFGKIRFPHDSPIQKLSLGRKALGVLSLLFTLYLIPGLSNTAYANLKLLSGFPPPLSYSLYKEKDEPTLGLPIYKDWNTGVDAAKREQKPILIDFTGWACVNCRKMEEQVWSQPRIQEVLKNEFIIISLYVDDRRTLPKEDQFLFIKPSGKVKKIKTIGNQWATFQTVNFENNSQPYYVMVDPAYRLLEKPIGYTPDATQFYNWLQSGLSRY